MQYYFKYSNGDLIPVGNTNPLWRGVRKGIGLKTARSNHELLVMVNPCRKGAAEISI